MAGPPPLGSIGGSDSRIVIAGADPAQSLLLRRALELDGHQVVSCATGHDAVLSLLWDPPELLLINAPLPDGSAAALLRWTRSRLHTADLNCMVILPAGESTAVAELYDAGADNVITRPAEMQLLSRQIAATLSRRPLAVASA
jgi:DNA-binding response OmpR family regulator